MNKVMDGFLWFLSKGILLCGFCSYSTMFKLEEAKEKRKTEQSDNSSVVYYLGSLCFVKVSEMVKKMCSTVFFRSSTRWGTSMDGCSYGDMISACHLPSFSFCDNSSVYYFQALNLLLFQCTLFCVQLLTRGSSYLQILLLLLRGPDFSLPRKISLYPP